MVFVDVGVRRCFMFCLMILLWLQCCRCCVGCFADNDVVFWFAYVHVVVAFVVAFVDWFVGVVGAFVIEVVVSCCSKCSCCIGCGLLVLLLLILLCGWFYCSGCCCALLFVIFSLLFMI